MNPTITTILVIFTLPSLLNTHCRYDMNLEYLEILDIENNLNGPIRDKLAQISQENQSRKARGELFVNIVSKNLSVENYKKVFNLKKAIIQKNIQKMLESNCRETKVQAQFLEKKGAGACGVVTTTKVNLATTRSSSTPRASTRSWSRP